LRNLALPVEEPREGTFGTNTWKKAWRVRSQGLFVQVRGERHRRLETRPVPRLGKPPAATHLRFWGGQDFGPEGRCAAESNKKPLEMRGPKSQVFAWADHGGQFTRGGGLRGKEGTWWKAGCKGLAQETGFGARVINRKNWSRDNSEIKTGRRY